MSLKETWCFVFLFIFSLSIFSQNEEDIYVNEPDFSTFNLHNYQYKDQVFDPNIKSAQIRIRNRELSYPIIRLGDDTQLELFFDDLEGDVKNYSYTIVHCNYDWSPSDLSPFDYIDGFTETDIRDYSFSAGTEQSYTHYRLLFPNSLMNLTKTGNYVMVVYKDYNPENIILTKRFMVFSQRLSIESNILQSNISRYFTSHQWLDFSVDYKGFPISNPLMDIKVAVLQNGRWDNALTDLRPQFIRPRSLEYSYRDRNLFSAGKEFRFFDIRSIDLLTENVDKKIIRENGTHIVLKPDTTRYKKEYNFWSDLNGRFITGRAFASFSFQDSDYVWVDFELKTEEPINNGNVYLLGEVVNWNLNKENQMMYNEARGVYELSLFLKQGLYNYQYVVWEDGNEVVNDEILEGNYWQTENDYVILVYYRAFNDFYDQLVGVKILNSRY